MALKEQDQVKHTAEAKRILTARSDVALTQNFHYSIVRVGRVKRVGAIAPLRFIAQITAEYMRWLECNIHKTT